MSSSFNQNPSAKFRRAEAHLAELEIALRERPPFRYVADVDLKQSQRYTCARRNLTNIEDAATIAGDVVQNLRAALDHAWWEKVSQASGVTKENKLQFPFSPTRDALKGKIATRMGGASIPRLEAIIIDLQPFPDGDRFLWAVDDLSIPDRHKALAPIGDLKAVDFAQNSSP